MIAESLSIVAEVLLTSLFRSAVGKVRREPAVRALAEALDESVDRAVTEVAEVAGADAGDDVGRLLRQGARDGEVAVAVPVPDATDDASRALTDGVRLWVAAVDAPVGLALDGAPAPTRLRRLGVDPGQLAAVLDRHLRAAIARRAAPGQPLALVHDRLAAAGRHAEDLAGHARTHELLAEHAFPAARSSYLRNVERIAPPALLDRDRELAELAAFCTEPDRGPYIWWRAGAWAGKSALLATFALNPPPGVRVVPFFVTARFAGQSDRAACADALLEQLAELLGQPMPGYPTEAARDNLLTELLADAARLCQDRGERLVLLVDGLDEDRGVTAGPDVHSIAALLPAEPAAGMRVIVAGRPDPPVPFDVPRDHPLRDPAVVHQLDVSRHAHVARDGLVRELRRLLAGTPAERDLLGFVCAAGGGLGGDDLVELTGLAAWEVGAHLEAVSGRTFTRRPSRFNLASETYILAHEELQLTALEYLGEAQLATYRDRIHGWADGYRDHGWPERTPEYLLHGYVRMLSATADAPRLAALAADEARHTRLLDVTGGDAAALAEIRAAMDPILECDDPDLSVMANLALVRELIEVTNSYIPDGLPAVWVRLGHTRRGEALARAIPSSLARVMAWAAMAEAAGAAGDAERSTRYAGRAAAEIGTTGDVWPYGAALAVVTRYAVDRAEEVARSRDDPADAVQALAMVAVAAATTGDRDRAAALVDEAERLLGSFERFAEDIPAIRHLPAALAVVGRYDRAERLAWSNGDEFTRAFAVFDTARALAATGESERARGLTERIEPTVLSVAADHGRAVLVAELVSLWVAVGVPGRAADLALSVTRRGDRDIAASELAQALGSAGDHARAEAWAWSIQDAPDLRAGALLGLVRVLVDVGESVLATALLDRAEEVVLSVAGPLHAGALCDLAATLAVLGRHERATRLAVEAERSARSRAKPTRVTGTPQQLVPALATVRDRERLDAVLEAMPTTDRPGHAVSTATPILSAAGEHEWAERLAGSIDDPVLRSRTLVAVFAAAGLTARAEEALAAVGVDDQPPGVLAMAGLVDLAERRATEIRDLDHRARELVAVARAVASAGDAERAVRLASQAGRLHPEATATKVEAAEVLATAGRLAEAERLVGSIAEPPWQAVGWASLARAVAGDRGHELTVRAEEEVRATKDRYCQYLALRNLAPAVAAAGDPGRAEALAGLTDPTWRHLVLVELAPEVDPPRARRLLAEVFVTKGWTWPLSALAEVDPVLLRYLADEWLRRIAT